MNAITGDWGNVFDTSIIGIHQVVLGDGRVLFWGGDGNGNAFSNTQKYGIFDPETGQHEILSAAHAIRMFCGAGVIIPGTDKVLIAGGNGSGAPGGQIFDTSDETLVRDGANDMATGRFYPTTISLSTGQVVVMGGNGNANLRGTPEIFTPGEGWRKLDGATDPDVAANWWYPKAWVNGNGEIVYIAINAGNQNANPGPAGSFEVMAMDPSGTGSIRKIGEVPFQMDAASTAVMYDVGKVIIMDHVGDLWYMDINGDTPTFEYAADLGGDRNNADMTVLPDGQILINGGTEVGNSQSPDQAILESQMFNPYTGEVTTVDAEAVMRLYHSSSVLLNDGTILSMGGGGLNGTVDMMDAQIYRPPYLYNDDGTLADRPQINVAPASVEPGQSFIIEVDDASSIQALSFNKTGAVTHSNNMESGRMNLDFRVLDNQRIEVSLPDNPHVLGAGNWMLFAIDENGVPSEAPIISVEPTLPLYTENGISIDPVDGILTAEYYNADVSDLDEIDFTAAPVFEENVNQIQKNVGSGAFYQGGPADKFAVKYSGQFVAETAGQYTFYLNSDDGSRLAIDGTRIIDNDGLHSAQEQTANVYLDAGIHDLNAEYFEQGGDAVMELDWKGPGFDRTDFEVNGTTPTEPGNYVDDVPNVTQYLNGIGDNDVFVIAGNSSDYGWGVSEDGESIVVWGPTGHDLLYGFEKIRFEDMTVPLTAEDGQYHDIANVTQYLTGTDDVSDTFIINGNATDYNWAPATDGEGIVVWGPTGHDLLYGFEKIRFNDTTVSLVSENGEYDDVPNVTQYLTGAKDASDTFVINGNSADYNWADATDGEGIVVWGPTGHDLLYDFDKIAFNDKTVELTATTNPGGGVTVQDDPARTQYETGTDQTDRFVIDGNSADYGWDVDTDGEGIVVWNRNEDAHDLLYDFEEIEFNDQVVELEQPVA
ncbi:MAG: DUF1929 domain-containing protein [Rhizobiaceae bacterium]|nr:DUF1929 domain-containing protein [Rhizobiaceae bacterium]